MEHIDLGKLSLNAKKIKIKIEKLCFQARQ